MSVDPCPPPVMAALAARGLVTEGAVATPLAGGRTNASWAIGVAGGAPLVVKTYRLTRANLLFPNDPDAEVAALKALAGTGIAPDFRAEFGVNGLQCLAYDYVDGRALTCATADMARTLGRLHVMHPPKDMRRIPSSPEEIALQTNAILDACDTAEARAVARNRPDVSSSHAPKSAFLHGDPVPSNAILSNGQVTLIDWQCPGIGDPVTDIAVAVSPAMQHVYGRGRTMPDAFLAAYPDQETVTRYRAMAPILHWRIAAYCLWKAGQGEAIYRQAFELECALVR